MTSYVINVRNNRSVTPTKLNFITGKEKTEDTNIKAMLDGILQHGMFHECDENQGLWNIFTDYKATAEQSHDMLNYREIGQVGFETRFWQDPQASQHKGSFKEKKVVYIHCFKKGETEGETD